MVFHHIVNEIEKYARALSILPDEQSLNMDDNSKKFALMDIMANNCSGRFDHILKNQATNKSTYEAFKKAIERVIDHEVAAEKLKKTPTAASIKSTNEKNEQSSVAALKTQVDDAVVSLDDIKAMKAEHNKNGRRIARAIKKFNKEDDHHNHKRVTFEDEHRRFPSQSYKSLDRPTTWRGGKRKDFRGGRQDGRHGGRGRYGGRGGYRNDRRDGYYDNNYQSQYPTNDQSGHYGQNQSYSSNDRHHRGGHQSGGRGGYHSGREHDRRGNGQGRGYNYDNNYNNSSQHPPQYGQQNYPNYHANQVSAPPPPPQPQYQSHAPPPVPYPNPTSFPTPVIPSYNRPNA